VTDASGQQAQVALNLQSAWFNGKVNAMAADDKYLYFGGQFTAFRPTLAPALVALDPASGALSQAVCHFAGLFEPGAVVNRVLDSGPN
jgi:hypothetical protein